MNNSTSQPRKRDTHNIVIGQKVTSAKVQLAKELRHQMTQEEQILWQYLRANRLNGLHFRRQQIIDGFIADFYCHAARLVIEVDGEIHQQQAEYDAERDQVLLARGLRLLRIKNEEVRQNLNSVLTRISNACCEETEDEEDDRLSKPEALKYYQDYPFAKELIADTEGHVRKVVIDFNDYQRLLELIEDEGLTLAMREVTDETPLSQDEALKELEQE